MQREFVTQGIRATAPVRICFPLLCKPSDLKQHSSILECGGQNGHQRQKLRMPAGQHAFQRLHWLPFAVSGSSLLLWFLLRPLLPWSCLLPFVAIGTSPLWLCHITFLLEELLGVHWTHPGNPEETSHLLILNHVCGSNIFWLEHGRVGEGRWGSEREMVLFCLSETNFWNKQ